jgi:AcrR family transcriptional regulator
MPRETFKNLPDEKRQLIEKESIHEFAISGYDKASISRIVEKSGIAKGSFYQYFNDKKDLFLYLINRVSEKKINFMSSVIQNQKQYDFFTLNRELFVSGLKFAEENPELTKMANWLFKSRGHPVYDEVVSAGLKNAQDVYAKLLKNAISRGEVRSNIDLNFVSHMISSINISIVDYYFQNIKKGKANLHKIDEGIIKLVDLFIDFIKNGIGTHGKDE